MSVIDASTRTVTATVPVGKNPFKVAVDPGTHTVYVTNNVDDTVSVIDGSTRTVTATVPVGKTRAGWRWIRAPTPSTSPTRRRHGVGDRRLDAHRHRHRARRQEPGRGGGGSGHPHRLCHQHGDDTVSVIDASTRTVTATVPVGKTRGGGGGSGHPHRLRHQQRRRHGVGDRIR